MGEAEAEKVEVLFYRIIKGIGVSKFCQVHEFHGDFFGQKAFFKVTSVTGHIYVADFPPEYQDWRTVDPLSLFEAPTIKKQANPEVRIVISTYH